MKFKFGELFSGQAGLGLAAKNATATNGNDNYRMI